MRGKPSLQNDRLGLTMEEDGSHVVIEDRSSGTQWLLDESTRFVARDVPRFEESAYAWDSVTSPDSKVTRLPSGSATRVGENEIRSTHRCLAGRLTLRWLLEKDRVRVLAEADGINSLALP